ncbi:MAG: S1C family serine protease [Acidimicrobiales bacterium]
MTDEPTDAANDQPAPDAGAGATSPPQADAPTQPHWPGRPASTVPLPPPAYAPPQPPTSPYGTPAYGTPAYGSPAYGTPTYGTPPYGAPQYPPPGTPYGAGYGVPVGPGGPGSPGAPGGMPPYGAHGWAWGHVPPPPAGRGRAFAAIAVALGVLVAAVAGGVVGHSIWRSTLSGSAISPNPGPTAAGSGAGSPQDAATIAGNVDPGLVDINVQIPSQGLEGAATGMVLTSTGEVLTNNHVINGATNISVTDIGNGKTYGARVLGYDRSQDVAVLQLVGASGLQTVRLGNSTHVNLGQGVVAIGNAGGQGGTPRYAGGSITALNQTITASDQADGSSEQLAGLIETDADIQSGDSGGPLVNTSGQVIGMDTAASTGYSFNTTGNQGFAVPINTALSIAKNIVSGNGTATIHIGTTALLGVEVTTNSSVGCSGVGAGGLGGLGGSDVSSPGALVCSVVANDPAADAGLAAGDVITSVASQQVTSAQSLTQVILGLKPGQTVTVGYEDQNGALHTVSLQLASGPAQ